MTKKKLKSHPEDYRFDGLYPNALEKIESKDRETMEYSMFLDEIYPRMDDPKGEKFYKNYREIIEELTSRDFRGALNLHAIPEMRDIRGTSFELSDLTPESRANLERDLSQSLLGIWQHHDRGVRGTQNQPEKLEPGTLSYEQDDKKVAWARVASKYLIEAAEIYQSAYIKNIEKRSPDKIAKEVMDKALKEKEKELRKMQGGVKRIVDIKKSRKMNRKGQ